MPEIVRTNSDVEINEKYGSTITYELVAVNDFLAKNRALVRATASNSLVGVQHANILEFERLTDRSEMVEEYRIRVFVPTETIVQRLGAKRAKDELRELGILGE